ncbi:DUF4407 domain-containing protein [Streptomyces sp. CBMA29]|uniref:DUF4407 domain-containing protein n=1 Tax=Streptomyces sp. CBMA29 TaxID=1896314 RepID=UPI001661BA08|nr:DUF4407 domain-containing protein [Streptomyces sp. CBMA29]
MPQNPIARTLSRPVGADGSPHAVPDLGRFLRSLTGVDEELLAEVRHERSKYTALGGVVLGTAVIAAFSMWNFATEALGRVSIVALLPTVIWLLLILNLDRWLVTPVPNARRRFGPVVLRLVMALLLGVVIAEPLVLRIFSTAIEEHIADGRTTTLDDLRGKLLACNPVPSGTAAAPPANCGHYTLVFGATPGNQADELATLREDATALQKRVDQDNTELTALDTQVRDECRQLIRDAASGLLERTSECQRLRAKARDFRATHALDTEQRQLSGMNVRIATLERGVASSRGDFVKARAAAVDKRMAEEQAKQREIGVLERMQALDELAAGKPVLFVGIWLVRALFVFLDVLPVMAKSLGGESTYERMLSYESTSAVKVHSSRVRLAELRALADTEIAQHAIEQDVRRSRAESEAAHREVVATTNIRTRQAISALEEELRRTSAH